MWQLSLITAPAALPVDLTTEAYAQCRIDAPVASQDQIVVTNAIDAARTACETYTRRQLITATWELWMDSWFEEGLTDADVPLNQLEGAYYNSSSAVLPIFLARPIILPLPPLQQVLSVKYTDGAGGFVTWDPANYTVDAPAGDAPQRGRIYPKPGNSWPTLPLLATSYSRQVAVKIQFKAGYGDDYTKVPRSLRQGMLLMIGNLFDNREGPKDVTASAEDLWSASRAY